MQRDDGLAGARAALHDEHALVRRADDDVLLSLDGGDDVAELSAAALAQRRQERALAAKLRSVAQTVVGPDAEVALAEEFVFDGGQPAAVDHEVPAAHQPHRLATRRAIKRLGDRRAPVDDQLVVVAVVHRETPDVEGLRLAARVGSLVDAPEHQRAVADVDVVEHLHQLLVEIVALDPLLGGAAHLADRHLAHAQGLLAHGDEALVGAVDVRLFGGDIGVVEHVLGV